MISFERATVEVIDHTAPGGTRVILEPVTLSLAEARVAIIGANGSGKSTLARLINGLIEPTSGRVLVDGLDTVSDGAAVRARVGFVFTDPGAQLIMPTPLEDIALSLRRFGLSPAERDARAREILGRYGLSERAEVSVHGLSGGQSQLLALAGVLATEPAILVCDEPTTLLDLHWRTRVAALLDGLTHQVIQVTHDLDQAARADRVVVVDDAKIVYDGGAGEAIAAYRELVAARVETAP